MSPTKQGVSHRVLLVDDDEALRTMMSVTLEGKGFEVVSAASVPEALKFITTESFDGLAVITAMRHSQPDALTLLVSGYPDVKSAMDAIVLEADQIMMKHSRSINLPISSATKCRPIYLPRGKGKKSVRYCSVVPAVSSKTGWYA
jgi:ActR/RegA family two-component response regulator